MEYSGRRSGVALEGGGGRGGAGVWGKWDIGLGLERYVGVGSLEIASNR